ncbi:hypothetical protein K504DRAFT_372745 [Pleomassaria siparia CBS 279.74]|uniref:Uncharacterized protein n=1 Tax=Pleomassaria siparia CBS 279.74 TaxID=1314801 RepID=A0A6G1KHY4_9PLEO|nr:hypothetical protein K504DRAFT_372745 [Pleomassaria siparia CBS 279.74]
MDKTSKVKEAISTTQDEPEQIDAIKDIRGWFGPEKDSDFYSLVQTYLLESTTLTQTITKLSDHIEQLQSKEQDFEYMDLWYSILHSAKRIPWRKTECHTKLVDLVKRMKSPVEENHHNFPDFSAWSLSVREVLNDSPGCGAGFSVPETHAWANLNYFLARVKKERLSEDFVPLHGLWALREALEHVHKDDGPHDAHVPGTKIEKYNSLVPAAATWVISLGKELYDLEKDMAPASPNHGNPAVGGELWKGKPEFSKGRWALWKKRFGEISKMEELNEETKEIAKEAVEAMEKAEGS